MALGEENVPLWSLVGLQTAAKAILAGIGTFLVSSLGTIGALLLDFFTKNVLGRALLATVIFGFLTLAISMSVGVLGNIAVKAIDIKIPDWAGYVINDLCAGDVFLSCVATLFSARLAVSIGLSLAGFVVTRAQQYANLNP